MPDDNERQIARLYHENVRRPPEAVEIEEGLRLHEKTRLFPVYHCGNRGVNQNRKMEPQLADREMIERYLNPRKPTKYPHIHYTDEREI